MNPIERPKVADWSIYQMDKVKFINPDTGQSYYDWMINFNVVLEAYNNGYRAVALKAVQGGGPAPYYYLKHMIDVIDQVNNYLGFEGVMVFFYIWVDPTFKPDFILGHLIKVMAWFPGVCRAILFDIEQHYHWYKGHYPPNPWAPEIQFTDSQISKHAKELWAIVRSAFPDHLMMVYSADWFIRYCAPSLKGWLLDKPHWTAWHLTKNVVYFKDWATVDKMHSVWTKVAVPMIPQKPYPEMWQWYCAGVMPCYYPVCNPSTKWDNNLWMAGDEQHLRDCVKKGRILFYSTPIPVEYVCYRAKVPMFVRSGPSTGYGVIEYIQKGEQVQIEKDTMVGTWGVIPSKGRGYSNTSLKYMEKVY